jgi:tryptophan synthase alpha chain
MSAMDRLEARFAVARAQGRAALVPYLMAGFPSRAGFEALCTRVAAEADVLELGLAFSDPTADGPVIAAAGRRALQEGAHLEWLCAFTARLAPRFAAGLVLMSYLNPLLAFGLERALQALAEAGFEGLIVPDLPLEESEELRALADEHGLALVQIVTPLTPATRAREIAAASRGFLYAVTRAGTTGARAEAPGLTGYLHDLRAVARVPVCAGFGLQDAAQVRALRGACDGVVIGTALIEHLTRGSDPVPFLRSLRAAAEAPLSP